MMISLALLLLARGLSGPGLPDVREPEDETVVTARKQAEALAEIPLSVSVVGASELEAAGIQTIRDAARRLPNAFFSEFSSRRLSFPFLRGIGSGSNDPSVITYIDDVPQFGFGATNLPLVAVERVEFLRGPQGTLYGRNALGGLIHVHGRRPTSQRTHDFRASFGSYDARELYGSYSGALGGGVLGDLALLDSERDGYTKNDATGNRVDDRDAFFGRGRLLWNPGQDSELDFSVFGERARDGGFVLSELNGLRDDPHHINQDFEGRADRDVLNPALVWRVFGEDLDFTSVSSWETWDVLETSDFDFSPLDGVRRRTEEEQSYVYQEVRLGSAAAEGGARATRWLVGASGFYSDAERQFTNDFRPDGAGILFPPANVGQDRSRGRFDDLGVALFGEVTVPVGAAFELTGGLRYDREHKEVDRTRTFDPGGGPFVTDQGSESETFDELLPSASVAWHVCPETLVFVRAARGFKAGGFNLAAPAGRESFDPETAWSYELGWRRSFEEERYELSATAFFIDWDDMQLAQFDANVGGYVTNAGDADSKGLEFEGRATLLEGLNAFASLGLLETEIGEFVDPFGTDTSGNELPFAPDSTWALGLEYAGEFEHGPRWSVASDYSRVGDFFYDAGNRAGDDFGLANLRLGLDGRNLGVALWVRNAFDEEYSVVAFQPSPNPQQQRVFVGESGTPRVLGFTLSVHL